MKQVLMVGLIALSLTGNAYAAADEGTKPEWFSCEKDKDCGRTETVCGAPKGVNLKHYKEYHSFVEDARKKADCAPTPKIANLRELKSVCVSSVCHFNPEPDLGGN